MLVLEVDDFIASPEGDCAMADDSISPLSAVVNNIFFIIRETSMHVFACEAFGTAFLSPFMEKPFHDQTTFECASLFRMELRAR